MNVNHFPEKELFTVEENGVTAYGSYKVHDGKLDILQTIVPEEISGRGIASELVAAAYAHAKSVGLKPAATCSYAAKWLERHPDEL